jgi:hypothetical protein
MVGKRPQKSVWTGLNDCNRGALDFRWHRMEDRNQPLEVRCIKMC